MTKPHSLTFKNIQKLRNAYEEHCELLNLKNNLDLAEQRGVLLGFDLVLEINQSIKEFQEDIKNLKNSS
tara:strand:+ start:473 stop:679 length:207 start_codon:yes stop_codon:yes gene_type:complete